MTDAKAIYLSALSVISCVGAYIADLLGGWTADIITLVICMVIDYIMGVVIAAVFKRSNKSANGALSSKAGWVGICRKGITLLIVLVAHRIDILLGMDYIRTAVVIGFILNEVVSITENAGIMGVPLPAAWVKAIDALRSKTDDKK